MQTTRIADQLDNKYPFSRALFEDATILYHGTWSLYSERIEREGFVHLELPFAVHHLKTISNAGVSLGIGSYGEDLFFSHAGGGGKDGIHLSMAESFWGAREYSTDGGGEVVRMMLKEARQIENYRVNDEARVSLKSRWDEGLKKSPNHEPTKRAVALLDGGAEFDRLCHEIRQAREAIEAETLGGFPVVYAIRVQPDWFPDQWERHLHHVHEDSRTDELRCLRSLITAERIVGKAEYPNGTGSSFSLGNGSWEELKTMGLTRI